MTGHPIVVDQNPESRHRGMILAKSPGCFHASKNTFLTDNTNNGFVLASGHSEQRHRERLARSRPAT